MFRALASALGTCSLPGPVRMSSAGEGRKGILADKVAVITGSTQGMGSAIAQHLARDGAHVVVSSRKQQNVDRAVSVLKEEGLSEGGTVCHAGKAEDCHRLVTMVADHYGGINFLVCVAGVNTLVGSTLGASEQVWDKILDVNVKSPVLLGQLLPHMEKRKYEMEKRNKKCSVILVSSISAYLPISVGVDFFELGWVGPKAGSLQCQALLGLTKTLAVELAPKGIWVNCLVPGVIKTDLSKVVLQEDADLLNQIKKAYGI